MRDRYIVIDSKALAELCDVVNVYMTDGYTPVGGICVVSQTYKSRGDWEQELTFFQAMTKPVKED